MKLKCDIRIQNNCQSTNNEKSYKDATLSIYRAEESNNSTSDIILIIKPKTSSIEIKYKLNKIETYTKFISEGKSTINLIDKNILLLISNTPSQNLINFISFLKIKFSKNKNIKIDFDDKNKENNSYGNKLLNKVDHFYSKNDLKIISPLTNGEISDLMKNVKKNSCTPVRGIKKDEVEFKRTSSVSSNALKELSGNVEKKVEETFNKSKSGLVKLTEEQLNVLQAVKDGKNVFITGGAGVGKSFMIKMVTKCLKADHLYITASTGIASWYYSILLFKLNHHFFTFK
jgi:ATP-dependent DNA helicase PIF1